MYNDTVVFKIIDVDPSTALELAQRKVNEFRQRVALVVKKSRNMKVASGEVLDMLEEYALGFRKFSLFDHKRIEALFVNPSERYLAETISFYEMLSDLWVNMKKLY